MRMIDADRLKAEIMGWYVVTDDLFGMGKYHEREIVLQAIEESPTISAVPVVRGEWIRMDETQALLSVEWKCSQCGQEIRVDGILTAIGAGWKYCPNCGCDMRGERDGEK